MKDRIREIVFAEGADVCGIAGVERFADSVRRSATDAVWCVRCGSGNIREVAQ